MTYPARVIPLTVRSPGPAAPGAGLAAGNGSVESLLHRAEWARAALSLEALLRDGDNPERRRAQLAECRLRLEDWLSAGREYAGCLSSDPDNPAVLARLAACHLHLGQPAHAGIAAGRALKLDPKSRLAQELLARLERTLAPRSMRGAYLVLDVAPEHITARFGEGLWEEAQAALELGRSDDARARLEDLLLLDPACLPARVELARWHQLRQHAGEARRLYESALRQAPDTWEAAFNLALLEDEAGEAAKSAALLEQVLLIEPECGEAARALASICERRGQTFDARFWWARALKCEAANAEGWLRMGMLEAAAGQLQAAAGSFAQAAGQGGAYEAFHNAAVCHAASGDKEQARQFWREARERAPARAEAPIALASLALESGDVEEAARWVREVVEAGHRPAQLLIALAMEFDKRRAVERAATYWRMVCEVRPTCADALVNLGAALRDHGDEAGARQAWRRAVAAAPALALQFFD
jgi:tetratricopeptide (TPR) repeat protein